MRFVHALSTALRIGISDARALTFLTIGLNVVVVVAAALAPFAVRDAADDVATGAASAGLAAAVLFVLARFVSNAGGHLRDHVDALLSERFAVALHTRVANLLALPPGIGHLETPSYRDDLEAYERSAGYIESAPRTLLGSLVAAVELLVRVGVLVTVHPLLASLPLFALPAASVEPRLATRERDAVVEARVPLVQADIMRALGTSPRYGVELRSFGLGRWLTARYAELMAAGYRPRVAAGRRNAVESLVAAGVSEMGTALALFTTAVLFTRGSASVGDLALVVSLTGATQHAVHRVVQSGRSLTAAVLGVEAFRSLEARSARLASTSERAAPHTLQHGIELRGVTFTYPTAAVPALDGVDLFVPPGSVVALVGENGAGKSTMAKLLLRLYEPTAGRILVDGRDLADIDADDWRRMTTAAFQDFARFHLTLREGVALGTVGLASTTDDATVRTALVRAGAATLEESLPSGLDTQLGREFDGADLSGGEWQTVALARAFTRRRPVLVVLDEPTASLDPLAAHQLLESVVSSSRELRDEHGAIVVVVSHRFSTVRFADLIVVLKDGRVVETGTHRELVRADGLYAELYELQRRAYS